MLIFRCRNLVWNDDTAPSQFLLTFIQRLAHYPWVNWEIHTFLKSYYFFGYTSFGWTIIWGFNSTLYWLDHLAGPICSTFTIHADEMRKWEIYRRYGLIYNLIAPKLIAILNLTLNCHAQISSPFYFKYRQWAGVFFTLILYAGNSSQHP